MFSYRVLLFVFFISLTSIYAQTRKPKPIPKDSLTSQAFLNVIENSLEQFYAEYANQSNYDSIINALEFEPNEIPDVSDEVICERLRKMNEMSPFHLECNPSTISVIRFFATKRRSFIRIALGRSKLYFEMYEEALARHDLPLDLRFLSVIESGLRPQVKSPAGALGLWQFMYGTGKMFGLNENSYFDERMDPVKSTDAACRYLKKLYGIYGDWNLALAAYNAGPGNINKAIRRSGGKRTYWEIRPFLHKETQGYVPNFIAAAYLMTYYAENNLIPMEAKIHGSQLDTMCLTKGVHMETIERISGWNIEEIKVLNPVYKKTYIPLTFPNQCITGPLMKIGKLVSLEDSLYSLEKKLYGGQQNLIIPTPAQNTEEANSSTNSTGINYKFHKVRKGETLTLISKKYKVKASDIMDLNNLRSTKVAVGKVLKIPIETEENNIENEIVSSADSIMGLIYYDSLVTVYHSVQRNEDIEAIAAKYNVKSAEIVKWNNLSDKWLNIDQKLLIVTKIKISKPGMVLNENKNLVEEKVVKEKAPVQKTQFYTVKSGDLFNRIAQKHGLTTQQLQKLNPSVKPDKINVGQKIRVK
jgi:membrane-bound lytic murein transglycosylase D